MRVVISQPMFLPWLGLFDQIRLADTFVHYDDVQMPQGRSFMSRVQIRTRKGVVWLTAPIDRQKSGTLISETMLISDEAWRTNHMETIRHCYGKRRNFGAMFDLVREIYSLQTQNLSDFNINAIELVADRIGLAPDFIKSSSLRIEGRSTQRLLAISQHFQASQYLTGHGAAGYLDHNAFDEANIEVYYMSYASQPWKQVLPDFTPFVSIIDLLAEVGFADVATHFASTTCPWQEFVANSRSMMED
jgi:hypothetical protein